MAHDRGRRLTARGVEALARHAGEAGLWVERRELDLFEAGALAGLGSFDLALAVHFLLRDVAPELGSLVCPAVT